MGEIQKRDETLEDLRNRHRGHRAAKPHLVTMEIWMMNEMMKETQIVAAFKILAKTAKKGTLKWKMTRKRVQIKDHTVKAMFQKMIKIVIQTHLNLIISKI